MASYETWVHGVAVQLEWASRASALTRTASGAIVRMPAGTHQWFHLPVPTLTRTNSWPLEVERATLRARLTGATIAEIHIRMGEHLISSWPVALSGAIDWSAELAQRPWRAREGLSLSFRTDWPRDDAELVVVGGGLRFVELEPANRNGLTITPIPAPSPDRPAVI